MITFLIILAGLAVTCVLSFVLSIALEMLLSIGELHAAMGGMGAFFMVPLAMVFALVATGIGLFTGATGWALFFSPMQGSLVAFGIMALLWFPQKFFGKK